ncbi:hypothetical protein BDF14DRAFT_1872770, partial [Spinellus fusiger]
LRWRNKVFDVPSWIMPIKDFDQDKFLGVTLFSALMVLLSCIFSIFYVYWGNPSSTSDTRRSIGAFNRSILIYLVATFFTVGTFLFMSVGKIWISFGAFHSLSEINMIFSLTMRNDTNNRFKATTMFIFLMVLFLITTGLPWPYDAASFKFIGLIIDGVIFLTIARLYYHNRSLADKSNVLTPVAIEEERENERYIKEKKVINFMPPVHENLRIIFIASFIHLAGNTFVTFANIFVLWFFFQLTYAVSFPLYAYYAISEPNASRIQWYKIEFAKEALVFVASFILSLLCIIIGAISSGHTF